MLRIPPALLVAAWPAVLTLACRGGEPSPSVPGLPFVRGGEASDFAMVSGAGDTIWFRGELAREGPYERYTRYRRAEGGLDSLSVTVDVRTKAPVASHERRHVPGGFVAADLVYGAGSGGQGRLTLTDSRGQRVEDLPIPEPYLDAAQIPQTLAALDFSRPDTLAFHYIAPQEKAALSAQLVIGGLDALDRPEGPVPAHVVTLRVSDLEERFWFAAPPGRYRLLEWRQVSRGVTWRRTEP